MKIFILEDDPHHIALFLQKLSKPDRVIHVANTVAQAIDLATKVGPFNTLFLDHDLAPEHYEGDEKSEEREPDGHDFTKWMVENKDKVVKDYTQIFIHSMNPVGSKRMQDTITDSAIKENFTAAVPFFLLIRSIA